MEIIVTEKGKRFFTIAAKAQSYKNILYLFIIFPVSIVCFVFIITGILTGAGTIPAGIGLLMLPASLLLGYAMMLLDLKMITGILGYDPVSIKRKKTGSGFKGWFKSAVTDPLLWKAPWYFTLKMILSTFTFAIVTGFTSLSIYLTLFPLTPLVFGKVTNYIKYGKDFIDKYPLFLAAGPVLGIPLIFVSLHLFLAVCRMHAGLAEKMITGESSRNRR